MSECPECVILGRRSNEGIIPCSLCSEKRCVDHTVWVPAHELEGHSKEAKVIKKTLKSRPHSGWYAFCGKGNHMPRGLSVRYGKNKEGGRIVMPVADEHRKLEFFKFWEVGIIEHAVEHWWPREHYALSCSVASAMVEVAHLVNQGELQDTVRKSIYDLAIVGRASKKSFFHLPSRLEFMRKSEKALNAKDFASLVCSYCTIVPCFNRLKPFHDRKQFQRAIDSPV